MPGSSTHKNGDFDQGSSLPLITLRLRIQSFFRNALLSLIQAPEPNEKHTEIDLGAGGAGVGAMCASVHIVDETRERLAAHSFTAQMGCMVVMSL